jgi:hypothetical protein
MILFPELVFKSVKKYRTSSVHKCGYGLWSIEKFYLVIILLSIYIGYILQVHDVAILHHVG